MSMYFHKVPVIESGSLKVAVGKRESKRLDEVKRRACGRARPCDISRILRDFGFYEDDM